jgi:hypothetical protein
VQAKRDVAIAQGAEHILVVPTRMPELDRMLDAHRIGQHGKKPLEAIDILRHLPWQLVQHRAQLRSQLAGTAEETLHRLVRILQLLHVRQETTGFYREQKPCGHSRAPLREHTLIRQAIKAVVDLDGVELPGVILEPLALRNLDRIEVTAPMPILPA